MKWRWIAAMVCMLFVSVSFVAAAHDHSGHALNGDQQCATCAWHHDSQVDVPKAGYCPPRPETFAIRSESPAILIFEVSVGLHNSRGPPSIPHV